MRGDAFSEVLGAVVTSANNDILATIGTLAALGAVAMALVQIVKELTPMRTILQRRWLVAWLDKDWCHGDKLAESLDLPPQAQTLIDSMADVTAGGEAHSLYELAGDQMMQQMLRSAPVILDNPRRYCRLLVRLTRGLAKEDLSCIMHAPHDGGAASEQYYDARARALRRIERNLDGAALVLTSKWRFWMHCSALAATLVVVSFALWLDGISLDWEMCGTVLVIVVLGGYFAPVTKDLLTALRELRSRP